MVYSSQQKAWNDPASEVVERLLSLLRRIEPHIDAIVCYASTTDEHEPNRLAVDLRTALSSQSPHPETGEVAVTTCVDDLDAPTVSAATFIGCLNEIDEAEDA